MQQLCPLCFECLGTLGHCCCQHTTLISKQKTNKKTPADFAKPVAVTDVRYSGEQKPQSSGAVWKSRWPSWAPVPNKPTVSVAVKQHFNQPSRYQVIELPSVCRSQSAGKIKIKNKKSLRGYSPFKARELRWRSKSTTLKTKEKRSLAVDMKTVQHVPRRFWIHASSGVCCKAERRARRQRREFWAPREMRLEESWQF